MHGRLQKAERRSAIITMMTSKQVISFAADYIHVVLTVSLISVRYAGFPVESSDFHLPFRVQAERSNRTRSPNAFLAHHNNLNEDGLMLSAAQM